MKADPYDVRQRAWEKQQSREADAQALASGEKTRDQLRIENRVFTFPRERLRVDFSRVKIKR
jgi:hypothetical protein